MASFTYYGPFENVEVRYTLTQDQEANTSTISATAYHKRPSGSGGSYNYDGVSFTLTINGNQKTLRWSWNPLPAGGERAILSHTVTIAHNGDGSHAPVSIAIYCASGASSLGTISASTTVALSTIPRGGTITVNRNQLTIGSDAVTITVDRKSASFRHRVYAEYDGRKQWIEWLAQGVGADTARWTPPMSLCRWRTNAPSFSGVIGVVTYQSDSKTVVGDRWVPVSFLIPASVAPTISSVYHYASAKAVNGEYWQNHTRVGVGVRYGKFKPSDLYGATLERVEITAGGKLSVITRASHPAVFSDDAVGCSDVFDAPHYGLRGYTIKLIDSRGRTATKTGTYSVIAYELPQIRSFSVERCDQAGRPTVSGGRALANYHVAIAPAGDTNTGTLTITSDSGIKYTQSLGGSYPNTRNTSQQVGAIDTNRAHTFTLTLRDKAGNQVSYQAYVGKGNVLFDICPTGVSAGETAEPDTVSLKSGNYRLVVKKSRGIYAQEYSGGRVQRETNLVNPRPLIKWIGAYPKDGYIIRTDSDLGVAVKDYYWTATPYYYANTDPFYVTVQDGSNRLIFYVRNFSDPANKGKIPSNQWCSILLVGYRK